jgi:hypothetical protein
MFAEIHPVFSEIKHADGEAELLLHGPNKAKGTGYNLRCKFTVASSAEL